jgi:hypothetical protein
MARPKGKRSSKAGAGGSSKRRRQEEDLLPDADDADVFQARCPHYPDTAISACQGKLTLASPHDSITITTKQASDEEAAGGAEDGNSSDDSAEETVEQKKLRLGTTHQGVVA